MASSMAIQMFLPGTLFGQTLAVESTDAAAAQLANIKDIIRQLVEVPFPLGKGNHLH